jgi:flagellar biosynthesis/type III secretory pathway protein FliH
MTNPTPAKAPGRLVALRVHPRRPAQGAPDVGKALLDLKAREQAQQAATAALRDLCVAARTTVTSLPAQVDARLEEVAGIAVELGLAIARELVGAALAKGLVDPTPTVVRCLRDCVHGSSKADLVVRLHPQDLAAVQERLQGHPELQQEIAQARFVGDAAVPRGGVRAETGAGRLLYDPNDVLARICDEVRREATS